MGSRSLDRSPEEIEWRKAIYGLPVSAEVYSQVAEIIKAALMHQAKRFFDVLECSGLSVKDKQEIARAIGESNG